MVEVLLVLASLYQASWAIRGSNSHCEPISTMEARPHSVTITEFGAVGDGVTLNSKAFHNAIFYLQSFADKGGAQLFVPAGRWLTGSFELISHLTLLLDKEAVILGSKDSSDWAIEDPLPSYGRGRELPGGRHQSLIYGNNLTDVIITGNNGTIDGQGSVWWNWFRNKSLNYTRPHLVELKNSTAVVISNLTFLNSPFWGIHPVYCSKVLIQNITILAPLDSPNTDGIDPGDLAFNMCNCPSFKFYFYFYDFCLDSEECNLTFPDSSTDVCIEDCYISTGDDLISIKSGWDEYGISYARPSSNIMIHRLSGETGSGAGISIGSEMSGGVSEVHAEGLRFFNSANGIRIKTAPGRGGYIRNVYISDMTVTNVKIVIRLQGQYGEHPDEFYDPNALPLVEKITIKDVTGENISRAGVLEGIQGDNFLNICLFNITLSVTKAPPWNCSYIQGYSNLVSPKICESLSERIYPKDYPDCYFPSNHLRSSVGQSKSAWLR
ncbi:hypothetical protein GIB67_029850 [Kingdonia uniflora]|uniref:Polygalacturonase n=1 Tax=Kingdonia uniflora TaxID=39325 RepID=A0A7J7NJS8_9MAGN|nr:hypothetical protein GIB67_029850 [Kingdonia uniflora]